MIKDDTILDLETVIEETVETVPSVVPLFPADVFYRLEQGEYTAIPVDEGGEGQVSRIVAERDGVNLSIKSILLSGIKDLSELDRLDREWEIVRTLSHPNLVRYRGRETREVQRRSGVDIEYSLLADWVDGEPLSAVLQNESYTEEKVLAVIDNLFDTLSYLHTNKVLHRDLKPSNIIRRPDGGLTLIDFGFAKKLEMTTMTASKGRFIGSIPYASPEVLEGKPATAASDLYAVGVIGVTLLRGKEFDYRYRPSDIRETIPKIDIKNKRLKSTLEALLIEDPAERREKLQLVDGKYQLAGGKYQFESKDVVMLKVKSRKRDAFLLRYQEEQILRKWGGGIGVGLGLLAGIIGSSGYHLIGDIELSNLPSYSAAFGFAGMILGGVIGYLATDIKDQVTDLITSDEKLEKMLVETLQQRGIDVRVESTGFGLDSPETYAFEYDHYQIHVEKEGLKWKGSIRGPSSHLTRGWNSFELRGNPVSVVNNILEITQIPPKVLEKIQQDGRPITRKDIHSYYQSVLTE